MQTRLFGVLVLLGALAFGQGSECRAPLPGRIKGSENMFNAQQEVWLGEAMADSIEASSRVIHDPAMNAYLQAIADRLLAAVDTHGIQIKLKVVESAEVNGFTIADGRVYLTRKLLVAARNEDEIAGVMAHEFGHALTGQIPTDWSRRLRDTLHITSVSDRKDVFNQFNLYTENVRRQKIDLAKFERFERDEQTVADQVAITLLARAGYGPHSYADFWDRIAETQGKTGNGWTDLFGMTKPESRRLRMILQQAAALTPECHHDTKPASSEFRSFQAAVTHYSYDSAERAVMSKAAGDQDAGIRALDPPLRSDIFHMKFSQDGRYVLAQDETGVFVLTRNPFGLATRIEAPNAYKAMFSPDSAQVVTYNRALRVETWDIARKKLVDVHEVVRPKSCLQAIVSPDGRHYACTVFEEGSPEFGLEIRDVASGQLLARKKDLHVMNYFEAFSAMFALAEGREIEVFNSAFSPDGKYFIAAKGLNAFAFDLNAKTEVKLPGALRDVLGFRFDWVGSTRILGVDTANVKKSGVVEFPSGAPVLRTEFATQNVQAATKGDYALLGPTKEFETVVYDLRQSKIVAAHNRSGIDVFEDAIASDLQNGDIELLPKKGEKASVTALPVSPLQEFEAAAVSPDLRYLAISLVRSSGVYDTTTGKRLSHLRPFEGAYLEGNQMVADFPKMNRNKSATHDLARMDMQAKVISQEAIDEETTKLTLRGRQMLRWTHPANKARPLTLNVVDPLTGKTLWTREYAKEHVPTYALNRASKNIVAISTADQVKDAIRSDPKLADQLAGMTKHSERGQIYYFEVLDAATGKRVGHMLCDTGKGSFLASKVQADGDVVVMTDSEGRLLLYSLTDGHQIAHFVGRYVTHSPANGMVVMRKGPSELHLISSAGENVFQRQFSAPIAMAAFSEDGKRLLVLTDDQKYRILNVTVKRSATATEMAGK